MSESFGLSEEQGTRVLQERELDSVTGGNIGYPGLPLGTNINVSPWGLTTPFDLQWALWAPPELCPDSWTDLWRGGRVSSTSVPRPI